MNALAVHAELGLSVLRRLAEAAGSAPATARVEGGRAIFENERYRITIGDDAVTVDDKRTGDRFCAWSDASAGFGASATVHLDDGTRLTMETSEAARLVKVSIADGDHALHFDIDADSGVPRLRDAGLGQRPVADAEPVQARAAREPARQGIGEQGLALVKRYEGLRLTAYRDPVGIWTIGYGHTVGVRPGQTISAAQAELFLRRDLRSAEQAVRRHVKVPLTQGQFDALVSFTFNVGAGALQSSTLLRKLNAGDLAGAHAEFGRWVHADGQRLEGLVRRRADEARLFGSAPAPAPARDVPAGDTPRFRQGDPQWGARTLGQRRTIAAAGCAMSSVAMAISKISGRTIDPGQLDRYLDAHGGYVGDMLVWNTAARAAGLGAAKHAWRLDTIDRQLAAGRPVVVGVDSRPGSGGGRNGTDHWIAVTGRGTVNGHAVYYANDPATGRQITLREQQGRLVSDASRYTTTGELVVFSGGR